MIIIICHTRLQVRLENMTKERDMLRQAEGRLNRDKEAMLAEQRNQNLLLVNLKTIQVPYTSACLTKLLFVNPPPKKNKKMSISL